jgi:hypothetical protein
MLSRRRIDITITLGEGRFGEQEGDTVDLTGFRVHAHINAVGGEAQGQCQCIIYGLPLSTINRLTTIGPNQNQIMGKNTLTLKAGDDGETLKTVFVGQIFTAYGEFNQAPDVGLSIVAYSAAAAAARPADPASFKGAADVAEIMAGFAQDAGYSFKDGGVKVTLSNPYFYGTKLEQIRKCARDANIEYSIDKNVLSIWPVGGHAEGEPITLRPLNGLVGYPQLSSNGISITSIFNPAAELGGRFIIEESELPMANGNWGIFSVVHALESETPNGQWFTYIEGSGRVEQTD